MAVIVSTVLLSGRFLPRVLLRFVFSSQTNLVLTVNVRQLYIRARRNSTFGEAALHAVEKCQRNSSNEKMGCQGKCCLFILFLNLFIYA